MRRSSAPKRGAALPLVARGWLGAAWILCAAFCVCPAVKAGDGPALDAPRGAQCLLPNGEMRRQHPDMLKHQRDRTVRLGERGAPVSLRSCINCHANAVDASVLGGPTHFCQGCHEYVGVRLDCFECHTPKADAAAMVDTTIVPSFGRADAANDAMAASSISTTMHRSTAPAPQGPLR
jgi:hypothetical protein